MLERPGHCTAGHPDFGYDQTKAERCLERLRESEAKTFRASTDIFHMVLERRPGLLPYYATAASVGKALICDPTLPPNSLVAFDSEERIVVAALGNPTQPIGVS